MICVVIVLCATRFTIVFSFQTMHWSGWVLMLLWPAAGLAFTLSLYIAPEHGAVLNAIAASYPVLVSLPALYFFMGDAISLAKFIGTLLTVSGVLVVMLAK